MKIDLCLTPIYTMLKFAEEILLLLHDEARGDFAPGLASHSLNTVLVGAVLMDLALENRIDTDPERLILVDATPFADDLLDPILADIARDTEVRDVSYWVAQTAKRGDEIRDRALARLVSRGILESESEGVFFLSRLVSRSRRYPTIDGRTVEEVKLRIMRVLFSDEIPDPRDIVIICLANACGLFENILSKAERAEVRERIDLIQKMDLIGQSVTEAVQTLEKAGEATPSSKSKEIPRAPGLPIIGNLFDLLGKNLGQYLAKQYLELGPLFEIGAFNRKMLVMAGTEANLFVSRKGKDYLRSHEAWAPFGHELNATRLLTSMDGGEHFRLRRVMRDGFASSIIADRLDTAVEIARREIDGWSPEVPVPCFYAFQCVITEQIGILCANTSPRTYLDDLNVYIDSILKTRMAKTHPAILLRMPHVRRAAKRMDEFYEKILAESKRERPQNGAPSLIDDVLEFHRTDMQFMPETNLKAAVLAPFVAGLDTVPAISAFMLYNVLKHPDMLAQMRAEADALFADGLSGRSLRQMDVTHRVALETLRLYPIGVGIRRVAANSFEFAGYRIPAGTEILIAMSVPHILPEYYPDPDRFDIDRYRPERNEHKQLGAFAPFGLGTHLCLGNRFAEVQIALNIATILHEADLRLDPPNYEMKIKMGYILKPADSFKLRLIRRR